MWRRIAAALVLAILLSCQVNNIAGASSDKPISGIVNTMVHWDPPEPE